MADFRRTGILQHRPFRRPTDPLQSIGDPIGIARVLHGRGIGQKFTLPTDGCLDEIAKECPGVADHHQTQSHHRNLAAALLRAACPASAAQQVIAHHAQHHDAVQDTDQTNIQTHVAMQDVAELVRDHALQLIAAQGFDRSTRDADDRIGWRVTGRKGVDAQLLQHIDRRHRRTGCDCHLLHHVENFLLREIIATGNQQLALQQFGDTGAAPGQAGYLVETAKPHHAENRQRDPQKEAPIDALKEWDIGRKTLRHHPQHDHHQQIGDGDET